MTEPTRQQEDGATARLDEAWRTPTGFGYFSAVNNTVVGRWMILTGFTFFLLGGILALLIRTQLIVPEAGLINAELYNQIFTMHGTTMMFLFAVPIVEGFAAYLMPQMLGARDLPFPRLSAYGYWCYLIGGVLVFSSIFVGASPDGGWFMYVPMTSETYSPGIGTDIWLLGLTFVEISALSAALELIVGVLKTRAPGLSINRIPIFAWAVLVTAFMIVFGFPPLLVGDIFLELQRAFGWPFFDTGRGGDPLLWQHLFWFFGHPEVYIIFLPAAGIVSMIVATFARRPLVGYTWIVAALVATGFISFGLWVHHMFTTGIPRLSLSFFSAASMAVAVPSGIQVFAWLATLFAGRPVLKTPLLFVYGFLFIFVLGGLTGVMVAFVPFDWQVHDSYFVVAHLHYVLFGGMVFPIFAAFYYWVPVASGRHLSERLGRWVFWLMFIGFNVSFLPMHLTGLTGLPRRVYTYPDQFGWATLNLISSLGAYLLAAGILLFVLDLVRHRTRGARAAANPWQAGTLDWLTAIPSRPWSIRSVPRVEGRYPLWDNEELYERTRRGGYYLSDAPTVDRETLITHTISAEPEQVLRLPKNTWLPLVAAVATGTIFIAAIFKAYATSVAALAATTAIMLYWLWTTSPIPATRQVDAGGGLSLPLYRSGAGTHARLAMLVGVLIDATLFGSLLFTLVYLWTASPESWPTSILSLDLTTAIIGIVLLALSSGTLRLAGGRLDAGRTSTFRALAGVAALFAAATLLFLGSVIVGAGISPSEHAAGAAVWAIAGFHLIHLAIAALAGVYLLVRSLAGRLAHGYDADLKTVALFWHYTTLQGMTALIALYLLPV